MVSVAFFTVDITVTQVLLNANATAFTNSEKHTERSDVDVKAEITCEIEMHLLNKQYKVEEVVLREKDIPGTFT